MVGVQNSCRCITCSSSGSHGWVTATAQPPGEMVRLQSASREKSEIQSAVPLNAHCFCTIEKLKNCKLSHRINWGPSAYILRKIQRHNSDYPDVNTVTIFLSSLFSVLVCFLLRLQSWGWTEHTGFFLYTVLVFIPSHLHKAAALHLYEWGTYTHVHILTCIFGFFLTNCSGKTCSSW